MHVDELLDLVVVIAERQHLVHQELQGEVTGRLLQVWFNLVLEDHVVAVGCPFRLLALYVYTFD